MPGPRQPPSWGPNLPLLLATGQKGLEVVTVGYKDEKEKKRCPGA